MESRLYTKSTEVHVSTNIEPFKVELNQLYTNPQLILEVHYNNIINGYLSQTSYEHQGTVEICS